jgi:hypothetical protein
MVARAESARRGAAGDSRLTSAGRTNESATGSVPALSAVTMVGEPLSDRA